MDVDISHFQCSIQIISSYQGRRVRCASRLPLAVIFRAFGAGACDSSAFGAGACGSFSAFGAGALAARRNLALALAARLGLSDLCAKPFLFTILRCFSLVRCIEAREHVLDVAGSFDRDINSDRRIPKHARHRHRPPEPVLRHHAASCRERVCGLSEEPRTIAAPDNKYVAIPE
jgi:hypothetical protein